MKMGKRQFLDHIERIKEGVFIFPRKTNHHVSTDGHAGDLMGNILNKVSIESSRIIPIHGA